MKRFLLGSLAAMMLPLALGCSSEAERSAAPGARRTAASRTDVQADTPPGAARAAAELRPSTLVEKPPSALPMVSDPPAKPGVARTRRTPADLTVPPARIMSEPPTASAQPVSPEPTEPVAGSRPFIGDALTNSAVSSVDPQGKFARVRVFYATDRAPLSTAALSGKAFAENFRWPALLVAATIVLLIIRLLGLRGRVTGSLTVICVAVALGWLMWAGYNSLQMWETASRAGRHYGNERGKLELGSCEVTIPQTHEVGEVESPSIWKLEFRPNAEKHVVFQRAERLDTDEFYGRVRTRVDKSARRDLFVFVHGFNVSFEKAARRTAQIAYDLNFEGAPVFFSWPSQGGPLKYTIDKENSEWAASDIKEFLRETAARSKAEQIHLVAHSMGNRALTYALRSLSREIERPLFNEVVLTAPDIDAEIFKRDLAPAIKRTAKRVTLYASDSDQALKLSKQINGYPRAGDSGSGLIVLPGIDTIDASGVDTSLLGHSYYGSNGTVLSDLLSLLKKAYGPDQRECLSPRDSDAGLKYWVFENKRAMAAGEAEAKRQ